MQIVIEIDEDYYEIIKEKVSGKRFSRLQSFSKQNAVKL